MILGLLPSFNLKFSEVSITSRSVPLIFFTFVLNLNNNILNSSRIKFADA